TGQSYNLDKDLFSSYGNVYSLKKDHDDKDKNEDPSAGSDQGLKKLKTSKDDEPQKGSKSKESKTVHPKEYHRAPRREQRDNSSIRHHSVVQNGCSFHGLRSEDPNQHLKDFLKLVDSINLDGENRERKRLCLFQFSLRDQASNWLERLPA
nr:MAK10-like protein [Tanacetum cinerariifolium]